MLFEVEINKKIQQKSCTAVLDAWNNNRNKVFVFRATEEIANVRDFYESIFSLIGTPKEYSEDASISERGQQRTGAIWTEVRYDPKILNAYRHSSEAQPLHTDGSYIPHYPSTLMCCVANSESGGETIFVDSEHLANYLNRLDPELFNKLTTQRIHHARSGDNRIETPFHKKNNRWFVNWNYYCVNNKTNKNTRMMIEKFQNHLNGLSSTDFTEKILAIKLKPGDAVFWKDDQVLHGRNSFSAKASSERFLWKCAISINEFTTP